MRKLRKGFTIVELVIVIAVIAVLTAVLVPTFISLSKKSKESVDKSLVHNLNVALKADVAEGKEKPVTMQDAVDALKRQGYYLPQLVTKSDEDLVYSIEKNEFCLSSDAKGDHFKYWHIENKMPETLDWSIYAFNWEGSREINNLTVSFDAGEEEFNSVKYERAGSASDSRSVILRSNSGDIIINAPFDTFKHYGTANVVNLSAVASSSFYENGSVEQVSIKKGRLVITNHAKASVDSIYLEATNDNYDNIILATQKGATLPESIVRDTVSLPEEGDFKTVVTVQTNVNSEGKQPEKTETINLYSTQGTSGNDVYEANNGYDVSPLAVLVVEASSDAAKAQAAEQIADPEVVAEVIETKTAFEVASQADMDSAFAAQAKYIKVTKDFTANKVFILGFNTVIDGANHTLTSSANRIFRLAGSNTDFTFRNLKLISTYSQSDSRCISIDSNYNTMHLVLENCELKCGYYALNITGSNGSGSRNINIEIFNSRIEGYAAINNHASSAMITVNSSTLIGNNKFAKADGNSFATIVFDGGNYEYAESSSYGNKIVVNNSTLKQISAHGNYETAFSAQYGNIDSEAHFNNCVVEHEGENTQYFNYAYSKSLNVKIYMDGELYYEGK